jgi:hypothetical protein
MKTRVTTRCVANTYTGPNERIIEFHHANGGGLIAFFAHDDGTLSVDVYNTDDTVRVRGCKDAKVNKTRTGGSR